MKTAEDIKQELCTLIGESLNRAKLSNWFTDEGNDDKLQLLDLLSKSGETIQSGQDEIDNIVEQIYFDLDNWDIDEILQTYHASHLEGGIKAKAIRMKGKPEKWVRYDARIHNLIIEAEPCPIYSFEEIPMLPEDAELIDITIIINK